MIATVLTGPFVQAQALRQREWLVTNGLGGYASGSLAGIPTRKYHGLFVPNLAQPKGRHLLISRLDEEISFDNRTFVLGGADHKGAPDSDAQVAWLRTFHLENNVARWTYDFPGVVLEKSLVMPHLQNTVCVNYRVLADVPVTLKLRPFLPFRRHDADLNEQGAGSFITAINDDRFQISLAEKGLLLRMTVRPQPVIFVARTLEAIDQLLSREKLRGYPCLESTFSPGYFQIDLEQETAVSLLASTEAWEGIDFDAGRIADAQSGRTQALLKKLAPPRDEFSSRLMLASDQFLIQPESRPGEAALAAAEGHALRTVIAGYHWFGDWGRDTMIALEGIMLCTGRSREARATLLTFSHYIRNGLLPNLFPEGEQQGRYHTVDATLWYFHAIQRYLTHTGDTAILTALLPGLREVIDNYLHGTLFGIHVDPGDGLVAAGSSDHPLTWMDAHAGDWIVTPRRGKPVEIQALWYNALRLMHFWDGSESATGQQYAACALQAKESFNRRFWNPELGYLNDVVDGDSGDDASLRPNQIFSLSLDYPVLDAKRWPAMVEAVETHLLTPYGLRTLDPRHPDYRRNYHGDLLARDAAYHQGTVWPWLLGHFIDAWLKVHDDPATARNMLAAFPHHLDEAGLGSISEIFDAEWPHTPHGCIAQAWSVAEVLRAWQRTAEPVQTETTPEPLTGE